MTRIKQSIMDTESFIRDWFRKWETGDYHSLPFAPDFRHVNPNGVIEGRDNFLKLIDSDKENFTGYKFEILDEAHSEDKAAVRYRMTKPNFKLDVSEWYYFRGDRVTEIVSYYSER